MKRNTIYALACLLFFMASCQKTELLEVEAETTSIVQQGKKNITLAVATPDPVVSYKFDLERGGDVLSLTYEGVVDDYINASDFSWSVQAVNNAGASPYSFDIDQPLSQGQLGTIAEFESITDMGPLEFYAYNATSLPSKGLITSSENSITLVHNGVETIFLVTFQANIYVNGVVTPIVKSFCLSVFPNDFIINPFSYIVGLTCGDLIPFESNVDPDGPGLGSALVSLGGG